MGTPLILGDRIMVRTTTEGQGSLAILGPVVPGYQLPTQSRVTNGVRTTWLCRTPDWTLWRMGRLDDLAWAYAVENATGQEIDLENPPRDTGFLAARDACTDEACLCELLIQHTNDSLGGTSPYPQ